MERSEASSPVRIVCFDWGGVILRHCRSWEEGCAAAQLPVHAGIDRPELIARRRQLTQQFQIGAISTDTFFAQLVRAVDGLYSEDELRRLHDAWLLDEYPGMHDLVTRLHQRAAAETALLSNTNAAHWRRHLPKPDGSAPDYPTAGLLMHRHASHLLGAAKPGLSIYKRFEQATNASGSGILFFDDLPDNVEAARAIGWRAVLIDHTSDTAGQIELHLKAHGVL